MRTCPATSTTIATAATTQETADRSTTAHTRIAPPISRSPGSTGHDDADDPDDARERDESLSPGGHLGRLPAARRPHRGRVRCPPWSIANSPAVPSPSSVSAPGSSAATGVTSARTTRSPSSTPPSTPASRSSTPPTSTATAAASGSSAAGSPRTRTSGVMVATKMGRRVEQQVENYSPDAMRAWNDRSRVEPRRRHPRPRPAALPAHRALLHRRRLRRPRRAWSPRAGWPRTA